MFLFTNIYSFFQENSQEIQCKEFYETQNPNLKGIHIYTNTYYNLKVKIDICNIFFILGVRHL